MFGKRGNSTDPKSLIETAKKAFAAHNWPLGYVSITRAGEYYEMDGDYKTAMQTYSIGVKGAIKEKELEGASGDLPAQLHNYALAAKRAGVRDEARTAWEMVSKLQTNALKEGEELVRTKQLPAAIVARTQRQIASMYLSTLNSLVRLAIEDGNVPEARKWAVIALELDKQFPGANPPNLQDLKEQLMFIKLKPGDLVGAQKVADKLSKAQKKNARKRAKAKKAAAEAAGNSGLESLADSKAGIDDDDDGEGDVADEDDAAADRGDRGDSKAEVDSSGYSGPRTVEELAKMDPSQITPEMLKFVSDRAKENPMPDMSPEFRQVVMQQRAAQAKLAVGQIDEGMKLLRSALKQTKELYGDKHPYYAQALQSVADATGFHLNDPATARPLYAQALAICDATAGEGTRDYGVLLHNYAVVLREIEPDRALEMAIRALALQEKQFGEDSAQVYVVHMTLAELYSSPMLLKPPADAAKKAELHARRGLEIAKNRLPRGPQLESPYNQALSILVKPPFTKTQIERTLPIVKEYKALIESLPQTPARRIELQRVSGLAQGFALVMSGALPLSALQVHALPDSFAGESYVPQFNPRDVVNSQNLVTCSRAGCSQRESPSLPKFKLCGRCKLARYCSAECQKGHWKSGHKAECKSPAELLGRDSKADSKAGAGGDDDSSADSAATAAAATAESSPAAGDPAPSGGDAEEPSASASASSDAGDNAAEPAAGSGRRKKGGKRKS